MTPVARRGFALPLALLLMLVGTVLAMSALHVARSDFESNRAVRLSHAALRAAEAGGTRTLLRWDSTGAAALVPGDSVDTGWQPLPGGAVYRTVILRVDDGTGARRFRLRSAGRPGPRASAQRVLYTLVVGGRGAGAATAALLVQRRLRVRGGAGPSPQVDGADRMPVGWAGVCPATGAALPGVLIGDPSDLQLQSGGAVDGDPGVAGDPSIDNGLFTTVLGRSYADLAAGADVSFGGTTTLSSSVGPRLAGGECDESSAMNWGDPVAVAAPCGDYFPVIHVAGNLQVNGGGVGQGILLVDGDLSVNGPLNFAGVIVVLGTVDIRNLTTITGALMVRNGAAGNRQSEIRAPAQVLYSACAVSRAAGGSAPRWMAGRHWFDVG